MKLCFGIFARILNCCNQGLSQEQFVPKVAWVVDRRNRSLASNLNFLVKDPDGMEGNKEVVSKLLACTRPLVLNEGQLPTLELACERFESKVLPYINESKIAKAVLATLYIIYNDETIEEAHKGRFKECLGKSREELLRQTTFNIPDFFARVLIYTTYVDNKEGRQYAKEIQEMKDTFVETVAEDSWAEAKWDASTQTVKVIPSEEACLRDEISTLSELRLSLLAEPKPMSYMDKSWLGVDEGALFPSSYRHIEFKDPECKRKVSDKLMQYMKLVREFTDCLVSEQQSAVGQLTQWPIFPSERMRNIRQQLVNLSNELFVLGMFSGHPTSERTSDSPLKIK